jgi:hypothetical protein
MLKTLTIENIDVIADKYIDHWKVHNISISPDSYYIKVIHNGSPFDSFHLIIDRKQTSHGDYHIWCPETNREHYIPIECITDREVFLRFLIDELTPI